MTVCDVQGFAPAKINLFLHVGDRRPDGYHDLLSLVVFADYGDIIDLSSAGNLQLVVSGPHAHGLDTGPGNLVIRAGAALQSWARAHGHPASGAALHLHKNLPVASGVGGGSSDAAATLRILAAHWALPVPQEDLLRIARTLGADVPVCLSALPSIMSGDGDRLRPAPEMPDCALLLVNPRVEVSTASVFAALGVRSGTRAPVWPDRFSTPRALAAWLDRTTNDLAAPARLIAPAIMQVEQALVATSDCLLARMSGSGATCFGIYPALEAAEAAADRLRKAHPEWWLVSCRLAGRQ